MIDDPEAVEYVTVALERPFLTTNFSDYTVTEGLLLFILLAIFAIVVIRILRRGFRWLI